MSDNINVGRWGLEWSIHSQNWECNSAESSNLERWSRHVISEYFSNSGLKTYFSPYAGKSLRGLPEHSKKIRMSLTHLLSLTEHRIFSLIISRGIAQALEVNVGIVPWNTPRPALLQCSQLTIYNQISQFLAVDKATLNYLVNSLFAYFNIFIITVYVHSTYS
jgi:hypothetical protein